MTGTFNLFEILRNNLDTVKRAGQARNSRQADYCVNSEGGNFEQ